MIEHYTEAGRGWGVHELQTIVLCLSVCLSLVYKFNVLRYFKKNATCNAVYVERNIVTQTLKSFILLANSL